VDKRLRFYIWTIGCQMNVADSRLLAEELAARGIEPVKQPENADIIILNTCVVRQSAENKTLGRLASLKPLKEKRPHLLLAVMGCAVGTDPLHSDLPATYPYVDLWLPPSRYEPLLEQLDGRAQPERQVALPPLVSRYVTIMSGCDNFCSYCIVPLRRGRERSKPVTEVLAECEKMVRQGAREITLLGQNVDSYGKGLPGKPSLAHLLRAIHDIDGLWRIRFLTNHPKDMSQELIEAVAELPKVCEHIELPLQSGNDDILRRMNRHYTRGQYLDLVRRIRTAIPDVSLVTDVIVGFPGETRDQFEDTYRLLQEVRFDAVHVACYSPRPGTAASRLPDDVPAEEKEHRRARIEQLQEAVARQINSQFLGKTVEVLVEVSVRGKWRGRTRTNKLVFLDNNQDLAGKLVEARITWAGPWSMQGELVAVRCQAPLPLRPQ